MRKKQTLNLKRVNANYKYKELSNPLLVYPLFSSKGKYSTDYTKVFVILSQKSLLSQEHFIALQALKKSYIVNSINRVNEKFCSELYSEIRRVFLDTEYDYRLRLKSLDYMSIIDRDDFPDAEVAEAVEVIATKFGNDKNTRDARKRAVLFIKKHNIM